MVFNEEINKPVLLKRHLRTGRTIKEDIFPVVLIPNTLNSWDVAIQTNHGIRNVSLDFPYLNINSYMPDSAKIRDMYNKAHKLD